MKLARAGTATNAGLVAVIALACWLIYKMVHTVREGFESVYAPALAASGGLYASAEESFEEEQQEEESYAELLDQDETYAELADLPESYTQWGDGTPINDGSQTSETFTTLLAEPAYGSDAANALFSPTL